MLSFSETLIFITWSHWLPFYVSSYWLSFYIVSLARDVKSEVTTARFTDDNHFLW